jgi:hypothetical protein
MGKLGQAARLNGRKRRKTDPSKKKIGWPKKRERRWKKRSLIFLLLSSLSAEPSGALGITEKQPDRMAARNAKTICKKRSL